MLGGRVPSVKTLVTIAKHAAWWGIVVAITLAMDGTARWFIGGFLIAASVAGCISTIRDQHAATPQPSASLEAPPERPAEPPVEPPRWTLSLLVDADEESGLLRPSLRIGGPRTPICATVHLEVFDQRGDARLTTVRRFALPEAEMDLALGILALPEGVSADDAAGWDWDVMLREGDEELVRRRGPLAGAGDLNGEAELEAPDLEPAAPAVSPPDLGTLLALLAAGVHEYVELDQCPVDRTAARLLPEHVRRSEPALPIGWRDGRLLVAIANASTRSRLGEFQIMTGCEIDMIGASPDALRRALDRLAAEAA